MRAALCHTLGSHEQISIEDTAEPTAGPGQVLIRVHAAGINFADLLMVSGKYQEKPPLPFSPGLEASGTVEIVGAGVVGLEAGQRVLALVDYGGFAEFAIARAEDVIPLPDHVEFDTAAALAIAYGTAHGGLTWRAGLQHGEKLLVNGAAGGVGLAAVECGKALGATVIATARGANRTAIAQQRGADFVLDTDQGDLAQQIRDLTDGHGVDVVFDPIGGDVFRSSLRATAWEGRLVLIGFAAGDVPQIPANHLLVKNVSAIGFYWGSYRKHDPERLHSSIAELFDWYGSRAIDPLISDRFALDDTVHALSCLAARKIRGKGIITVP